MKKIDKIYHLPIGLTASFSTAGGPSLMGSASGVLSAGVGEFSGSSVVFKSLESGAKSLFENSPTLTSQWMDGVGNFSHLYPSEFGGAMHRLGHGHSIFHDLPKVFSDPSLSTGDFFSHLGTDVVTKKGIPLSLSPEQLLSLKSSLGDLGIEVSKKSLEAFSSYNIFDLLGGGLALYDSSCNFLGVLQGELLYNNDLAIKLVLSGTIKLGSGMFSSNPLLIVAGVADYVSLGISYYEHANSTFGVPFEILAEEAATVGGIGVGITAFVELIKNKGRLTKESIKNISFKGLETGILGAAKLANPPLAFTYTAARIGKVLGEGMVYLEDRETKNINKLVNEKGNDMGYLSIDSISLVDDFKALFYQAISNNNGEFISYFDLYEIREILRSRHYKLFNDKKLDEHIENAFQVSLDILNPKKVRDKAFLKNILALLGSGVGFGVLFSSIVSFMNPGLWASVLAFFTGASITGPVGISVGTVMIIGSFYLFLRKLSPENQTTLIFDLISKSILEKAKPGEAA